MLRSQATQTYFVMYQCVCDLEPSDLPPRRMASASPIFEYSRLFLPNTYVLVSFFKSPFPLSTRVCFVHLTECIYFNSKFLILAAVPDYFFHSPPTPLFHSLQLSVVFLERSASINCTGYMQFSCVLHKLINYISTVFVGFWISTKCCSRYWELEWPTLGSGSKKTKLGISNS